MKKVPAYICLLLLTAALFCGCTKKVEPSPTPDLLPATTAPVTSHVPGNEDLVPSPDNGKVTDGNTKVSPSPNNAKTGMNNPRTK